MQVWKMRTNNANIPISCLVAASSCVGPTEGEIISSMRKEEIGQGQWEMPTGSLPFLNMCTGDKHKLLATASAVRWEEIIYKF